MLASEKIIMSSEDNALVLTNMRVKYETKSSSSSVYKSIPIGQVATCALSTRSFPVLLVLAAIAVLLIFGAREAEQRIGAGIAALIFVAAYFGSRRGQIEVFASSGESISVPTKGLTHDQVKKFLEAVEVQYAQAADISRSFGAGRTA